MEITIDQAREIHAKGYAVVADGDSHNFFIVKDTGEEGENVEG